MRSTFEIVRVTDDTVFLIDLDEGRTSVTNDAENVFAYIQKIHPNKHVVYRDSMGCWDEIIMDRGVVTFAPHYGKNKF
jgi:hypothetical protein